MSHFNVAVFTDETTNVDELLEPYYEGLEVPVYIYKTKEQIIQKIRNDIKSQVEDGPYSKWKKEPITYERNSNPEHINFLKNEFPKMLAWTDEDCYKEGISWYEDENIDENGNVLSTYNPNSKWDWYTIGGRWNGMLKASRGKHGEGGLFTPNKREKGKYDIAKVSDIDFSMDVDTYNKSIRWWEVVVEKSPLKSDEKKEDFFNYYTLEYLIEKYKNKENYALASSSFNTFGVVLPDGSWHDKGQMGWFACVSNEDYDWDLKYKEHFIDTANPDWTLTIVDCHI